MIFGELIERPCIPYLSFLWQIERTLVTEVIEDDEISSLTFCIGL